MKSFHTLLKIAKRELETLRRALAAEQAREAQARERLACHDRQLASERALATRDPISARAFSGFVILAARNRAVLEAELTTIAAEIERLRTLIAEAHVESRKFERLIELEDAREKTRREKREDAELDEMATMRAGRPG